MPRQADRRLSRPRPRVPGRVACGRLTCEKSEQLVRVAGPERGVRRGYRREMIGEAHGRAAGGGGGGGGGGASGGDTRWPSRHSGHAPGWPPWVVANTLRRSRDILVVSSDAR